MSERVDMWKTEDGKLWVTEENAAKHEKEVATQSYFDTVTYRDMISTGDDVINFLIEYKEKILEYYGIEKCQ